jgi:glyoxalase family protein
MITKGFHHITLVAAEAARTIAFYRDLLGISLIAQQSGTDEAPSMLYFGNDAREPGTLLVVAERPHVANGRPGAGGIHHFALTVETPEAQLMWKRRLQDHGVPVSGPYNRGWFRSIYFADPDGQIVEIATRGPGYALDEAADALGSGIVVPPGAELRGTRDEAMVRARTYEDPVPLITPAMRLDGLHHISGLTDDVEQIGDFYEAALGLRRVKRSVNQDDPSMPHWFWATYDGRDVAPRSSLTMFGRWANGGQQAVGRLIRAAAGVGQAHAIAFRADDEEQLRAWQDHIRSLGTETTDVIDHAWYRSIEFRAPDGLLMEISTDRPCFSRAEAA